MELIAPASPGGGWDMTARSVHRAMTSDDIITQDFNVENMPGGGGEVGWQYLQRQDAHSTSVNSSLLLTNNLLGQSDLSYEDFTPIAMLLTEWIAWATATNADVQDADELITQLQDDPESLIFGLSPALGSGYHLSTSQIAMLSGVEPRDLQVLVYDSGGEAMNALLGGHIDILVNSMSVLSSQYEAGEIDIHAVTSPERLEMFPDVPTWQELGVDIEFPHWRGVMGPPDMSEEEIAQYDEWFGEMAESEQWQRDLESNMFF
ncbi:tripartite tricarboxylate transporter substrate binding protein [Geomicrobium sp. JCM 19055]|uniref:tripartite tricarboxylate transporter substrate binding protein n=1 Tax=Geomicrobium sp. JCM 19055 TaxID=1460649 RepID=UPI00223657B5|nr:tripartite tricarboxylate transporter substrate-binding protein [Geomicrobium sp. JCM 19055]